MENIKLILAIYRNELANANEQKILVQAQAEELRQRVERLEKEIEQLNKEKE